MTPERWQRVKEVFNAVLECEDDPQSLLLAMTSSDDALRAEVERLLEHRSHPGNDFLERSRFHGNCIGSDDRTFQVGERIGSRWQVLRLLGTGGMGEVYEAFDADLEERVALKTIHNRLAEDDRALERFRREIRIARKIGHPNICKVYDLFEHSAAGHERVPFVTMEMLEGQTLAGRLRQGPLETAEALNYARQMCEGLAAAHANGIIHSDLKSANVMLVNQPDGSERVVIMDFGLARNFTPGSILTSEAAGTPGYMAPEQWTGVGVSFATDIYSFGIVLYEMVTGAQLFEATLSSALLRKQQTEILASRLAIRSDLDRRWDRVIRRCLQPSPANRFQDIRDVLRDFEPTSHLWKRLSPLALTFGLAAGTTVLWLNGALPPSHADNSILVMPFEAAENSQEAQYTSAGLTDELIGALARVPEIRVIAKDTALNYSPTAQLSDVATRLRVDRVVRGKTTAEGDELKVMVEVVEPKNSRVVWSQQFHRPRKDQYALHEEVRAAVVSNLQPASTERRRTVPHVPDSRAYRLYLEGEYFLENRQRDPSSQIKAAEAFEEAAKTDPQYADALVGIAEISGSLSGLPGIDLQRLHARQREAIENALRLDPFSPTVLAAKASALQHLDHDWPLAEEYLLRALKVQPGNARVHHFYAGLLSDIGRPDEAMREFQRALDLDPDSLRIIVAREICLVRARRYAQAKQQIIETLVKQPAAYRLYSYLGAIYANEGDAQHALESYQQAVDRSNRDPLALVHQAYGLASLGMRAQALKILRQVEQGTGNYFYIACVYGKLHEYDVAFRYLDRSVAEEESDLTLLKVHPYCDDLRKDARFVRYLKLMNFE